MPDLILGNSSNRSLDSDALFRIHVGMVLPMRLAYLGVAILIYVLLYVAEISF